MDLLDWLLLVIRWAHALGAVAWVGGGIFYLLVLRPALGREPVGDGPRRAIGAEFRGLVHTAIGVLLITGIILSAARLTGDGVSPAYVVVLAVKVALALYMFYVVRFLRRRGYQEEAVADVGWWGRVRREAAGPTGVLVAGVVVLGLADVLGMIVENNLSG